MLIHQIEKTHFSPSEAVIIDYILQKGLEIQDMTISQIAKETYTSSPLFIRIAKKLGYEGWNDFKSDYLKELQYLYAHQQVDASIPFVVSDDMMTIAQNISLLEQETLQDTFSLLKHDDLQKAIRLLRDAQEIDLYGGTSYIHLAKSFQSHMYLIQKNVQLCSLNDELNSASLMSNTHHCAILISYFTQSPYIKHLCATLKKKHTPIIAITNVADDELSTIADVTLHLSSRELVYTKIGDFASSISVKYILDILYSCLFSLHYQAHLENCIQIGKEMNQNHLSEYQENYSKEINEF